MNLSHWGRLWRLFLGCFLLIWAVAGGPVWAYIGVYFLLSGSFGFSIVRAYIKSRPPREDF